MTQAGWTVVRIPESSSRPLRRGHPWVWRDVRVDVPAGTPVRLEDRSGHVGWGLADDGEIAVRVLGTDRPERADLPGVLRDRVLRADRVRTRILDENTDAWRVVNAAGDGLPGLVVDRYAHVAIVRVYSAAWLPHLDAVVDAVAALPWCRSVARRLGVARVDGSDGLVVLRGPEVGDAVVVREHGMALLVRPHSGQKTGTFLDQREHRRMVRGWAAGRLVTNLFAYTGGFSVAAALGGAAHVTTVDLAPEAVADARENFRLNGLDPDAHAFEVADVFAWRPVGRPDLLIVDPPSLARGKRSAGAARSAYRKLHRQLGGHVARDGLLASSSCTSWMTLEAWKDAIAEGLEDSGPWSWLHTSCAPADHPVAVGHPEGEYLKFSLLRRR
ncbi:MAG: class I SAM-dependent rRNA methyltransferase [Alphaproteobacteria bacterium]|nr:class I SAM-dependent rRNA methyltransferase [Alphaproteobacteria bacterium]